MKLAAGQTESRDIDHFGWDELVAHKRKLSNDLKTITDNIIDMDKNQIHVLASDIRELRASLDALAERQRQIRSEVEKHNASLLSVSEKISQSKNFLSVMETRAPTETENELNKLIAESQALIDGKSYKNDREKNETLSKIKEASMKLEAIKAIRVIKDQFSKLSQESSLISKSILELERERDDARIKAGELNSELDRLFDRKRKLAADRESLIADYDRIAKEFEVVNVRLDAMAEMRRKQRQEYGHGLPSDALFKIRETAKKKLEAGGKLSFEELKLLYDEKE